MLDRDTDPNAPPPVDPTTRMRPLAFLRGAAGAKFSIYPEAEDQDLLISLPTYFNLAAGQVLVSTFPPSLQTLPLCCLDPRS